MVSGGPFILKTFNMDIFYDLIKDWKSDSCTVIKELKQENP